MDKVGLITLLVLVVACGHSLAIVVGNIHFSFLIGGITMWIVSMIAFNLRR